MASLSQDASIRDYHDFVNAVYGMPNNRHFDLWDMMSNVERFAMRGLKGIRKNDREKAKKNLLISLSWFVSIMNRLHMNLEEEVWKRFPYKCPYCARCPCECRVEHEQVQSMQGDDSKRPRSLAEFQEMFEEIYSHEERTLDHAGVHLAEEIGEFSEALLKYRGEHKDTHFEEIRKEAADVFSNIMAVFNSLGISIAEELSRLFSDNCHECHAAPCECSFECIVKYHS